MLITILWNVIDDQFVVKSVSKDIEIVFHCAKDQVIIERETDDYKELLLLVITFLSRQN